MGKATQLREAMKGFSVNSSSTFLQHIADAVCQIIAFSSDAQLRAIHAPYAEEFHHDLDDVIKRNFSGHTESALRLLLCRAVDR